MNEFVDSSTKPNAAAIAKKWATWPAAFGAVVGMSGAMKGSASPLGKMLLGTITAGMLALILGGITFIVVYCFLKICRHDSSQNPPRDFFSNSQVPLDEFYEQAYDEVINKTMVSALVAKAFSDADGDKKKNVALYIKLRVKQLSDEHQKDKPSNPKTQQPQQTHAEKEDVREERNLQNNAVVHGQANQHVERTFVVVGVVFLLVSLICILVAIGKFG